MVKTVEVHTPLYSSLWRIVTTTHHTEVGLLYFVTALFFFFVAGSMAMIIRAELAALGPTVTSPAVYNQLFTMHGTTMVFLWIMPALSGFINYLLPKFVGTDDMYFPRLNALSYWLFLGGGILTLISMANVGWTGYVPLSVNEGGFGVDLWALGLLVVGTSSLLGGFNFFVTFFKLKHPLLSPGRVSLFVWSAIATSILLIFAVPVFTMALMMLLADRNFGTTFFTANPILWQHVFWFFGHPEVYVLVLPAMGLVNEIIPRLARKRIVGYWSMTISILLITGLSFTVWIHHMFTTGLGTGLRELFMFTTMVIAIPSGVKVFNWVATMYGGRLKMVAPMKFSIGFVIAFIIGGITGVWLASIPVDYHLQDTYWVVGHFHFIVFATTQAIYAGAYYYFPMWTGRWYSERAANVHFVLTQIGMFLAFTSMLTLGLEGMPRRVFDYLPLHLFWNQMASIGGFLMGIGALVFLATIIHGWLKGRLAKDDPWNLRKYGWTDFELLTERVHQR